MVGVNQAVILCAGKDNRLEDLTKENPKVLIDVNGKSLLEYKLDALIGQVDNIILVVNYMADKIEKKFGNNYGNLKLNYVFQNEINGTGGALMSAKDVLDENFLVLNGDDIYSKPDLTRLKNSKLAILASSVKNPENFGVLNLDKNNFLASIDEKPENTKGSLVNIGAYNLSREIFNYNLNKSKRGEYEIVDYINNFIKNGIPIKIIESYAYWFPINSIKELEEAKSSFYLK